jgi:putative transposase
MRLVEQHRIDRHDSRFATINAAAFASKNLYNAALVRQMRGMALYHALPAKVTQWVLKQVARAWDSYLNADINGCVQYSDQSSARSVSVRA